MPRRVVSCHALSCHYVPCCATPCPPRSLSQVLLSSEDSAPLPLANMSGTWLEGAMPHFVSPRELRFDAFRELPRGVHYWVLPAPFAGDKVTRPLQGTPLSLSLSPPPSSGDR